jgi:hypothetical protein
MKIIDLGNQHAMLFEGPEQLREMATRLSEYARLNLQARNRGELVVGLGEGNRVQVVTALGCERRGKK